MAPPADPPKPPALTPHQIMWGYVAQTIGETAARANKSRVGQVARQMLEAGITPEEYRSALPKLLAKFAPGRIVTIGFLAQHWPYLRPEGMTTGRSPIRDAIDARGTQVEEGCPF